MHLVSIITRDSRFKLIVGRDSRQLNVSKYNSYEWLCKPISNSDSIIGISRVFLLEQAQTPCLYDVDLDALASASAVIVNNIEYSQLNYDEPVYLFN